ncbi:MAG: hypothetical protein ABIT38_18950 [Gemmatimonadaceae bacterium]
MPHAALIPPIAIPQRRAADARWLHAPLVDPIALVCEKGALFFASASEIAWFTRHSTRSRLHHTATHNDSRLMQRLKLTAMSGRVAVRDARRLPPLLRAIAMLLVVGGCFGLAGAVHAGVYTPGGELATVRGLSIDWSSWTVARVPLKEQTESTQPSVAQFASSTLAGVPLDVGASLCQLCGCAPSECDCPCQGTCVCVTGNSAPLPSPTASFVTPLLALGAMRERTERAPRSCGREPALRPPNRLSSTRG